jgi:hypothetical protein
MRNTVRALLVTALAAAGVGLALPTGAASAAPAPARPPVPAPVPGGYDISHPQCSTPPPTGQAWGVVGVNGGLATTVNPCLPAQLSWAWTSTGAVPARPKAQVYLNTANPGEVRDQVSTWPRTGMTPYGACSGGNDTACSWEYGWERAQHSVTAFFVPAAMAAGVDSLAGDYVWWLDVETENTWQSGSPTALARNRATLEGMTAYLQVQGGEVGLYSTGRQWKEIAGTVDKGSILYRLKSWLAGASTVSGAGKACAQPPLAAGGVVGQTQYVSGDLDHDVSCR